jgi:hypothetical protein
MKGVLGEESDALKITYSAVDGRYVVSIPQFETGRLTNTRGYGSLTPDGTAWQYIDGTHSLVTKGESEELQNVGVWLAWPASSSLTYTSFGYWSGSYDASGSLTVSQGHFVYGIPTRAGDVPLSGAATYSGSVRGFTDAGDQVYGTVGLTFDFGRGALDGKLALELSDGWELSPLPVYTFRDTVFSVGSTTFSGKFNVPGSIADSSFSGRFTGPRAAELMAVFRAPYLNPFNAEWGTVNGVWAAGKR